ncbi:MAG TPA: hypothetical protein VIS96_11540 [Terrimicrobiaceae bacterium]
MLAHAARHADEERIREANDIRLLLDEPSDEFIQLLCLVAVFSLYHRERHLAEFARVRHPGSSPGLTQQRRRIEELIQPTGGVSKESGFLLQIDVDPAEKQLRLFMPTRIIKHKWQVQWHYERIMPEPLERLNQGMIAQTRSTEETPGAGS